MTGLLETREYLKSFYAKNEIYVNPCVKFLLALISIIIINSTMGYMALLKNPIVILVMALMCSFMPKNFVVILGALWILLHSLSLAMECAVVMAAVIAIMFLLYFRFTPKHTIVVLLTPLMFALRVPYAMPVALGLLSTPVAAVSLSCGVVVYYMMKFMADK